MTVCIDMKAYVDISEWWPRKEGGEMESVYAVHKEIEDRYKDDVVTRHTLTRARNGQLEKGDFLNAIKLRRICSRWAGKALSLDDLVKVEDDD